jgi:hypothetical protein
MTIAKVRDGSVVTRVVRKDVHARETLSAFSEILQAPPEAAPHRRAQRSCSDSAEETLCD